MKQSCLDLNLNNKKTRKREFLFEMERVVPWPVLVELIAPNYPEGENGNPPFASETMLRIHFMQQWFTLLDPSVMLDEAPKLKAGVRAKVEDPFRVVKRQFGYVKVRYRELKKNTQQLMTLFALSSLSMVCTKLM